MDLVKRVLSFTDLVAGAALAWEPHRVAFWLQETIGAFHSYYTQGKRSGERFFGGDPVKTAARLALARALKQALRNGLSLLGVAAPERMESREAAEDV
jgi:arginyl-tRNA synthetase